MKVSICIPAYNSLHKLQRLLESIEEQTFKDFEVIITDDSDNYSISDYIELYQASFEIQYHKNSCRLGATENCNCAIKFSKGEYIKLMHHDDYFSSKISLMEFVELLDSNQKCDLAFSGTVQISKGRFTERYISKKNLILLRKDYRNIFLGNWIGAPSAMIFRNKHYIFDPMVSWLVDMELYLNILKSNHYFTYTEKPLISIGIDEEQLTQKIGKKAELVANEYIYIYEKYNLERKKTCKIYLMGILEGIYPKKEILNSLEKSFIKRKVLWIYKIFRHGFYEYR